MAAAVVFALLDLGTRPGQRPPAPPPVQHAVEEEPRPCPATLACPAPTLCPLPAPCPEVFCETCPDCPEAVAGLLTLLRRGLRAIADWDDGSLWAAAVALAAGCSLLRGRCRDPRANGVALGRLRAYP